MSLIKCNNLSVGYDGRVILGNINFSVNEGDYLCILGENGSGKSTLMRTLLGLQNALGGNIEYGDGLLKNQIGYLPQQTAVQRDFPASVYEIILSGCQSKGNFNPFYTKHDKQNALNNAERMGITHLLKRCYRELSGGQQQRVLLARALCATEKLIVLDEPVAGLDPKVTQSMYGIISDLNKNANITVIMVSHDVYAAGKYATHILHVGENAVFDTAENYFSSDIGKAFLKGGVN